MSLKTLNRKKYAKFYKFSNVCGFFLLLECVAVNNSVSKANRKARRLAKLIRVGFLAKITKAQSLVKIAKTGSLAKIAKTCPQK